MYSVVLVAALVTTSTTPNWHHRCGGCYSSCYSGYGCYNSGYSGYQASACHGGFNGYHGVPSYGAAGGCYGYHGGCYGAGYGATYGAYYMDPSLAYGHGCYGCYGGHSGYGIPVPVIVAPYAPVPRAAPKDLYPPINPDVKKGAEEIAPPKEKKAELKKTSRATIRMEIPQGATLFVDGNRINADAGTRVFHTPPLAAGERYFYNFRLEFQVNGQFRREERRVVVESRQEIAVDFSQLPPSKAIASRIER